MLAMAGLVGAVKKHNKHHAEHAKELEPPPPVPVDVKLQPDMVRALRCISALAAAVLTLLTLILSLYHGCSLILKVRVCDAFRINHRTKTALEEYDATTLEDLAYMTDQDYENLLATSARMNRPLCPLQQRKIAVLIWWVRDLVKDTAPFREERKKDLRKSTVFDRIRHSPSDWAMKIHPHKEVDDAKTVETSTIVPPDWEVRFEEDLPLLKKRLKEMGETTSFSLYSDFFLNLRWVLCGYAH